MSLLAQLSFGAPWILAALALLPAIWFLLRVTPPLPKRVVFPPLRLLLGLQGNEETPARTPLWLLLMRLVVAGAVIVALAEPLLGQSARVAGSGSDRSPYRQWMDCRAWLGQTPGLHRRRPAWRRA